MCPIRRTHLADVRSTPVASWLRTCARSRSRRCARSLPAIGRRVTLRKKCRRRFRDRGARAHLAQSPRLGPRKQGGRICDPRGPVSLLKPRWHSVRPGPSPPRLRSARTVLQDLQPSRAGVIAETEMALGRDRVRRDSGPRERCCRICNPRGPVSERKLRWCSVRTESAVPGPSRLTSRRCLRSDANLKCKSC